MANTEAASGQHSGRIAGSTRRRRGGTLVFDASVYCEPDPDDYGNLVSPKTLVNTPRFARGRIKDALKQTHSIITVRLSAASRPYDVATEQGMADEIAEVVRAIKSGTPNDRRCARLALAATLIILAERDDRPAQPAEGSRQRAASRPPLDLGV